MIGRTSNDFMLMMKLKREDDIETILYYTFHDEIKIGHFSSLKCHFTLDPIERKCPRLCFRNSMFHFCISKFKLCCHFTPPMLLKLYPSMMVTQFLDLTDYLTTILTKSEYIFSPLLNGKLFEKIKEKLFCVSRNYSNEINPNSRLEIAFELPDVRLIKVGNESFRCLEALFQPYLIDSVFEIRVGMPSCQVVPQCLEALVNDSQMNLLAFNIFIPSERGNSVCIGGSILAAVSILDHKA
ncbi:unnamed protein product [Hymenolepis diminuta]|uniref:Uncharacterized protein n=1 Tax=Hymenolepis diminuta TaxID=6216 RepID=A0A0R3SNG1_HYMDI|nr:unnamed protein product [Hymenolepis diminuta]